VHSVSSAAPTIPLSSPQPHEVVTEAPFHTVVPIEGHSLPKVPVVVPSPTVVPIEGHVVSVESHLQVPVAVPTTVFPIEGDSHPKVPIEVPTPKVVPIEGHATSKVPVEASVAALDPPSVSPMVVPSAPSAVLSLAPIAVPSSAPTAVPSSNLTTVPSSAPTAVPSSNPVPVVVPSATPALIAVPSSVVPSATLAPIAVPSSVIPSTTPSVPPKVAPSATPAPIAAPSSSPNAVPDATTQPTLAERQQQGAQKLEKLRPSYATQPSRPLSPTSAFWHLNERVLAPEDELDDLVRQAAAQYQASPSLEHFVKAMRDPRGDFNPHVGHIAHPAAHLLNRLRCSGAPVTCQGTQWTFAQKAAALTRGPYQSASKHILVPFLRQEFVPVTALHMMKLQAPEKNQQTLWYTLFVVVETGY
jgi:hypothetical protein